jgi:hypothetical protein
MFGRNHVASAGSGSARIPGLGSGSARTRIRHARRLVTIVRKHRGSARNPDYFTARRIQARQAAERPPEPLRLPRPLSELPWDIAQDEFGAQGADFLGIMSTLILGPAQDEIRAYLGGNRETGDADWFSLRSWGNGECSSPSQFGRRLPHRTEDDRGGVRSPPQRHLARRACQHYVCS